MQSLKQILTTYIEKDLGIPRLTDEMGIMSAWEMLGLEIPHSVATPEKLVSGVLYVNVKNSVWAQQLNMQKARIIESINKKLGKTTVKELRTRVGDVMIAVKAIKEKETSNCGTCGVEFFGRGSRCSSCDREQRSAQMTALYRTARQDPKLTYAQAKNMFSEISQDDLRRAKRDITANKRDDIERKEKRRGKKTN